MKRKILSLLMSLTLICSLAACGSTESETGVETASEATSSQGATTSSSSKTTLNVAVSAEAPMLDTHISTAAAARNVSCFIYDCLFELDADLNPQPQLLESYETEDNKTWIFHLRQGVLFHDGDEMKAEDVCASMNRWTSLNTTAKKVFTENEQFEIVDDYTVKLELAQPSVMLPYVLATPTQSPIITKEEIIASVEDGSKTGFTEYIGTGPMKFEEWVPNSYIKLVKNENYVGPGTEPSGYSGDKTVNFDEIYFYTVTDASIRVTGLQTGEYDFIEQVSADYIPIIESDESLEKSTVASGQATIIFNKKEGYFTDEKLRQAVNLVINVDEMAAVYSSDPSMYSIHGSYMPEITSTWYNEMNNFNTQNIEEAKRLVEESNYDGGEIILLTTQTYPSYYDICVLLEQELEQIGLNVTIESYDWATMLTRTPQSDLFDFYYVTYPVVSNPLSLMFLNSGSAGWTQFDELDSYFAEMNQAATIDEAVAVWSEAQSFLGEKVPMIKLYDTNSCVAYSNKLKGVRTDASYYLFGATWVD